MNRLRLLAQGFGLLLFSSLLISCAALSSVAAPTATPEPNATLEPPKKVSDVPRITAEELKERLDNGEEILIVDSRGASMFETRHIAGAVSVPQNEVLKRLDEFPRDQDIVFY
jgi:hypothetical protein